MKTVLVTGATGFLGSHVVNQLLADSGARLRILSRTQPPALPSPVEFFEGDIRQPDHVDAAVRGADEIYHFAGVVSRNPADATMLMETHVDGTRYICESARKHGVARIVVCTSSGTRAVSRLPVRATEDSPFIRDLASRWPYYLSKIRQEELALSFAHDGLPLTVINPSLLLGPGDTRMSSVGDVDLFLRRQIPSMPPGGVNFVDVRDAAHAAIRAMDRGQPGRCYLIGGHNMTLREFFGTLESLTGVRGPRVTMPEAVSTMGTRMLRAIYPLFGRQFPIDALTVEFSHHFWYLDNSRAVSELGLRVRPAQETLRDTIDDLRSRQRG